MGVLVNVGLAAGLVGLMFLFFYLVHWIEEGNP
jgi:hypothetical protein